MSTKFYCNSEQCTHADQGPFVLELAAEAVMDRNNLATIFCPLCSSPMKPLASGPKQHTSQHRFYCHNDACSSHDQGLFFIDLPCEAIMDNNNLATIFCPKCGKEMRPFDKKASTVINL
jgi:NADH pyrophosphatase NudC (nudix superfamily)